MKIIETAIPGPLIVEPRVFGDDRGFFMETWSAQALKGTELDHNWVQDNHSRSQKGVLRGLHFQNPGAQGKLVRCGRGSIFDVAVDVRLGSPTYGQWHGEELSFENGRQLWIPGGFLHGFATLEPDSEIVYKCTDFYSPECDGAVRWDSVGIDWPIGDEQPLLSEKDLVAPPLSEFDTPFVYEA